MNTDACEQIERVLLGACLLEDECTLDLLVSTIPPRYFTLDSHKRIARRIVQLYRQNTPVTIVSVSQELAANREVEAVGGIAYLASLTEGLPLKLTDVAQDHVDRLKEFWRKRELEKLAERIGQDISSERSHQVIQSAIRNLEQIVAESVSEDSAAETYTVETLNTWHREREHKRSRGLSFGIPKLDAQTSGLMPGEQTALGAASGVGKTSFMIQALFANCSQGIPCHAFLLEPTKEQVLRKLWSMVADVRYGAVTHPWTANAEEAERIRWAAGVVAEWPLRLNDGAGLDLDQVVGLGRLSINRRGTRLVILDYIQRLKIQQAERDEPMRLRVARASTGMSDLVKGTQCASLVLSQITTGRKNGVQAKPTMYDFRESSQIENDAHTIILLHREYDDKQGHYTNEGAILVPKQRFGSPCNIGATFDSKMATWVADKNSQFE